MVEFEAGELMLPIKSLEARLRWMAVSIEKLCSRADFPRTAMGFRRDDVALLLAPQNVNGIRNVSVTLGVSAVRPAPTDRFSDCLSLRRYE